MRRTIRVACILLFVPCLLVSLGLAKEKKLRSCSEIWTILLASGKSYKIKPSASLPEIALSDYAKAYFPLQGEHVLHPVIEKKADGSPAIGKMKIDPAALRQFSQADNVFMNAEYDKAMRLYQKAIALSETCYDAYLRTGDCFLFVKKDPQQALAYYKKALAVNPNDYRPHFFCGNACCALGDVAQARRHYLEALVLKPRDNTLMAVLEKSQADLHVRLQLQTFAPKALARMEQGAVTIYLAEKKSIEDVAWLSYAAAKAVHIGEKEQPDDAWSMHDEKEAIGCLLYTYRSQLEKKKAKPVAYLERLYRIANGGLINEFIIYEIMAQMYPDVVLVLSEPMKQSVKEYVKRFVFVAEP